MYKTVNELRWRRAQREANQQPIADVNSNSAPHPIEIRKKQEKKSNTRRKSDAVSMFSTSQNETF